uniref:Na_H_Exchanger domain-containing protein n=2 Tax=Meloidogyne TaxID=189290 RepID=A0A915P0C6_9BILA
MLLVGILFANFPWLYIRESWGTFLRKTAFLLILLRCGFGLNPKVLRKEMLFCSSLGLLTTIIEVISIIIISHFYFNINISVAILFGFVLASTSPAVTVPTMIELQHKHKGTSKGIPTIVLASALIDNIFCISAFSIAYEIVSSSKEEILTKLIFVPIQILVGLILGGFFGILIRNIPISSFDDKISPKLHFSRTILLCFISTALFFGLESLHLSVSGPIAVLLTAFLAAFVFIPKATVQAALAPILFDFSNLLAKNDSQFILQTCILSILFTAPTGQLLIKILGEYLLSNDGENKNKKNSMTATVTPTIESKQI